MPTLNITTNGTFDAVGSNNTFGLVQNPDSIPGDRVSASEIIADLSKAVAASVGKPEQYVMVSLKTDVPMCYAGSEEPCAYGELISIGGFNGKQVKISAAIMGTVQKHLGVDDGRFYLNFVGVEGSNFGWRSATF